MINILSSSAVRNAISAIRPTRLLSLQPVFKPNLTSQKFLNPTVAPLALPQRNATFFNHRQAQELWKCVTTVSNQGRQRGRAKGLVRIKNLHRGQKLGFGPARVSFPGLTTPIIDRERKIGKLGEISKDDFQKYEENLKEIRASAGTRRGLARKQSPLERGWTGSNPQGRKFGKPETPNSEMSFDNFESILIEYRTIIKMTGNFGRVRQLRLLMVTGNGNGTAGFSLTRSPVGRGSHTFQKAVNKAGLRLVNFDLYEGRTIYHDFFTKFGQTTIFAQQRPQGHGIKAHRVIKALCELIGIRDIECSLEGAHNPLHMAKAFFLGLLRQRTHQMLANEKRLHLVELRAENDNFPRLIASPDNGKVRKKDEIGHDEILDFETISYDGNLPYFKPEKIPFFERLPTFQVHLKKIAKQRHHDPRRLQMILEDGRISSHLTDIFPECKPAVYQKPIKTSN